MLENKEKIILLGGGGHARACIDVILSTNKYNIIGYLDIRKKLDEKYNIPYLGNDSEINQYISESSFLITVGQIKSSTTREKLYNRLKQLNANLPVIVSPYSYVSPYAKISEGTIIMHGAIIQFNSTIGVNCIINDKALVEHDVNIGNHCHISTAAVLNGDVTIMDNVFIGSGSVIKNGIRISSNVVVGSGSNVLNNLNNNSQVFGNPAK
jgi:sugar O-acyltransferase (sialic acid O-acetyltransferase NeuD family)